MSNRRIRDRHCTPRGNLLLSAALTLLAVGACATPSAHAQAPAARADLGGQVISVDDLPRDALGRLILDGIPGVLPRREVPDEVKQRLQPLMDLSDEVISTAPEEDQVITRDPLPGEERGPQPLDSGDPNPDRIVLEPFED